MNKERDQPKNDDKQACEITVEPEKLYFQIKG